MKHEYSASASSSTAPLQKNTATMWETLLRRVHPSVITLPRRGRRET